MSEYPDYQTLKAEFELTHFKVKNPLHYCQVDKKKDCLILRKKDEFVNVYQNLYYTHQNITENKGKKNIEQQNKVFVVDWMKDPKIRTYEEIDFMPCDDKYKYKY